MINNEDGIKDVDKIGDSMPYSDLFEGLKRQPYNTSDVELIMSRIQYYSKNMGALQGHPIGGSKAEIDVSLEDFCSSLDVFLTNTFKEEPYKTIIDEFNKYLLEDKTYPIKPISFPKPSNVCFMPLIIPAADDYINKKYTNTVIQKKDKFEKCLIMANILYGIYLVDNISYIRNPLEETRESDIWKIVYEIGFIQGEMCLIQSHLDPYIAKIHHSSIASQAKDKDSKIKQKEIMERNAILDRLYEEPLKYAEREWKKSKNKIFHNMMADKVIDQFPKLSLDRDILIEKLKPIAKESHYSDFSSVEFKNPSAIKLLCNVINNDNYRIKLHLPENTIDWLNEIIMTPDFYSKWFKRKKETGLSEELNELIGDTLGSHKKKFSELSEEEQRKIKRLNRLLLEYTYPLITPKSHKYGLMKGYEVRKKIDKTPVLGGYYRVVEKKDK